jgi:hypothetical protein
MSNTGSNKDFPYPNNLKYLFIGIQAENHVFNCA